MHSIARLATTRLYCTLVVAALLFAADAVRADVYFSNLGQTHEGTAGFVDTNESWASDFSTGGSATTITSMSARMYNSDTIPHTVTFSIFTNAGGAPGVLVDTFNFSAVLPSQPANFANYAVGDPGINLLANTSYWVVGKVNEAFSDGSIGWAWNFGQTTDAGSVFTTIPSTEIHFSSNSGTTFDPLGVGNLMYSLEGPAVPEPSSLLITATALSALACGRRRKSSGRSKI